MRITLTNSGGITGKTEVLGPIDTASLLDGKGADIEAAVVAMNFFELPAENFGPGADLFFHSTTVEDGERKHTVSINTTSDAPYRQQLGEIQNLLEAAGAAFVDAR